MKKLLYPLIAACLVTIAPFLLTFEKGQDIVRGLFCFSIFALLLLFVYFKEKCSRLPRAKGPCNDTRQSRTLYIVLAAVTSLAILAVAFIDLSNLLAIKQWQTGLYALLPVSTVAIALAMMKPVKAFSLYTISVIIFLTFVGHLVAMKFYPSQPLAVFPLIEYSSRQVPKPVERDSLPENFKYPLTESASITKNFIDTSKSNVIILVESFGIPLDSAQFEETLSWIATPSARNDTAVITRDDTPAIQNIGIHTRMYSRTRTAEREDLLDTIARYKDSTGIFHKDSTFLPQTLQAKGFATTYVFGGDSLEQWRYKYLRNIGFQNLIFGNDKEARNDAQMAAIVDSLLNANTGKQLIAWTTRNTKFPMPTEEYAPRLKETLELIANLAQKHPEVRFIIQGDHEPILSPIEFQQKFYRRHVPYIILN